MSSFQKRSDNFGVRVRVRAKVWLTPLDSHWGWSFMPYCGVMYPFGKCDSVSLVPVNITIHKYVKKIIGAVW